MTFTCALLIAVRGWFPGSFCYNTLTKLIEIKVHVGEKHCPNLASKGSNYDNRVTCFSKFSISGGVDKTTKTYLRNMVQNDIARAGTEAEKKSWEAWRLYRRAQAGGTAHREDYACGFITLQCARMCVSKFSNIVGKKIT